MARLNQENRFPALDPEGYLADAASLTESIACVLAEKEGVSQECPLGRERMDMNKEIWAPRTPESFCLHCPGFPVIDYNIDNKISCRPKGRSEEQHAKKESKAGNYEECLPAAGFKFRIGSVFIIAPGFHGKDEMIGG